MAQSTLEKRVAELEKQVEALLSGDNATLRTKDWRRTKGAFTGDNFMKKVFAEGRKIRQADGAAGRSRKSGKQQARA